MKETRQSASCKSGNPAMNKWIVSACFWSLAAAPAAAMDVRLDSYRNPNNTEGLRNAHHVYLDGAKSGLMAYNAWMKRHGQPVFCMPGDLALTTEQTEDIMLKSADKRAAKGDVPVALLLLSGLQDTFPCEKTDSR
jgi:hypothetical protein